MTIMNPFSNCATATGRTIKSLITTGASVLAISLLLNFSVTLPVLAQDTAAQAASAAPDLSVAADSVRAAIEEETQRVATLVQTSTDPEAIRDGWISLGDTLLAHEFNAEARTAYDTAASIAGADTEVIYRQGLLALFDGRMDEAIQAFGRATAASDETLQTAARVRRGRAYLDRGEFESAKIDFAVALALNPSSPAALAGAGRAALAAGDTEAAIDWLEQALSLAPQATRLYQPLGLAYRNLGDSEKARTALAQVGEGEAELADPVMAIIRSKSRSSQFWLQSGLAQADMGNFEGAADRLGRAVALAPDDLSILSAYGQILAHLGEFDLAHKALERVVAGPDATLEDWLYFGRVNQGLDQLDNARAAYTRASEMDPTGTEPQEALARMDLHEGKALDAADQFAGLAQQTDAALERARFGYWNSLSLLSAGDCEAAGEIIETAMAETNPVASDLLQLAARLRATCYESLNATLDEAVGWAEEVYQQQPGLLSSETLAMTYAASGMWQDAVDLQAQAMFEALKRGELGLRPALKMNMERYQKELPATRPFMDGDPIFSLE